MDVMDAMAHGLLHNAGVATIHPWVLGGGMGPTDWDGSGLGFIPLGEPGSVILGPLRQSAVQNTKQKPPSVHTLPLLLRPGNCFAVTGCAPPPDLHTPLIWFVTKAIPAAAPPVLLSSPRRSRLTTVALSLNSSSRPDVSACQHHSLLLFAESN
jgi:hypothetical protein